MEVGHLERVEKPNRPVAYLGQIMLGKVSGDICLTPVKSKLTDKFPDFDVKLRPHGQPEWSAGGGAWRHAMKAGGHCFTLSLDGPLFDERIRVSAFPDDEQPKDQPKDKPAFFTVVWKRDTGEWRAPASGERTLVDDEIPY